MIFRRNGDIVFEGFDRVFGVIVRELHGGNWEKAIADHIASGLRKRKPPKQTAKGWSEDLVNLLALYGLHTYCRKKGMGPIRLS